jgi:hypothetical protein
MVILLACGGEKFPLPDPMTSGDGTSAVDDTLYLQLNPIWGPETNATVYDFNQPKDILVGREPFIYIADSGNDRIVMLDLAGNLVGLSKTIENPVALTQDPKLRLLIVTDSNTIYRIDLVAVSHDIGAADPELVFEEVDNPDRRYTGISSLVRTDTQGNIVFSYYVTATGFDARDNQVLIFPEDFDVRVPSAVNLEPLGLGILSAAEPSGVTTLRDFNIDFIFCMVGQNSFKVQWLTGGEFGFTTKLSPADGNFDLFQAGKFVTPEDVTVDLEGNIYVIDAEQDFLYKFSAQADEQQSFGDPLELAGPGGQFNRPEGVAEFNKTLYIADTGNNRILRFKLSTDVGN